jgi:hypothetical protein
VVPWMTLLIFGGNVSVQMSARRPGTLAVVLRYLNLLKPNGNFTYDQV